MHALIFDGALRLDHNYPEPDLLPGEALIQPHLAGICNTDLEITRGYMGFRGVLGHEFVGTVVACAEPAWRGQRVVGEINAACLACPTCLRGDHIHCPQRTTLGIDRRDGAMAELLALPIACLHRVPDPVSDEAAVFTEPLAAALAILDQSHLRPSDQVAVVGDGKLGAMIVQVLRLTGCALTLVGRHPERWALYQHQGVRCLRAEELGGAQFDLVVDCTGQAGGLDTARALVRPRGAGAQEHLPGAIAARPDPAGGGRGAADRLALRAICPGLAPARARPDRDGPADQCTLWIGRSPGGIHRRRRGAQSAVANC